MGDDQPVVVIGGTRGTGLLIAQLLCDSGRSVRVLARDAATARRRLDPRIQVVGGDVTKPESLPSVLDGSKDIVFTAGVRSGRPSTERRVRQTEYQGVVETLTAAGAVGFAGRFLYMTASGVRTRSLLATALNLYKGNTLRWRARVEDAIRSSSVDYSIIRTGMLCNGSRGLRAVRVTQHPLPLALKYRISRGDVAEAFVAALDHPSASRATFELVWTGGRRVEPWSVLLAPIQPDTAAA